MIIIGYTLSIIGIGLAFFHREISKNPDDTTMKYIGVGILCVGAGLRITGNRKEKEQNPQ